MTHAPDRSSATAVRRVEDPDLIVGRGTFVDNLAQPPDTPPRRLRAQPVRPRPDHRASTPPRPSASPGVVAVSPRPTSASEPVPSFATPASKVAAVRRWPRDAVRYVGDPVALVVAETRAQAVDAAELVDVDYDPLAGGRRHGGGAGRPARPCSSTRLGSNVASPRAIPTTAATRSTTPRSWSAPGSRTTGVADRPDRGQRDPRRPDRRRGGTGSRCGSRPSTRTWRATCSRSTPAWTRADVRVVAPHVGGAFGGKAGIGSRPRARSSPRPAALGRPVAWTETRSEAMLSMHGRGQVQYAELGLTRDGRITGLRARVIGDCGAYAGFGGALRRRADPHHGAGPLRIPRIELRRVAGRSPTPRPIGAFRGAGRPEAAALLERLVDLAADELGLPRGDPAPQPHPAGRVPVHDLHRPDLRRRRLRRCRCSEALRLADVDARAGRAGRAGARPATRASSASASSTYVEITGFGGKELGCVP